MIWAVIIPSVASVIAAILGVINHKKIAEVHVLVNNRLDTALSEINDLKSQRDQLRTDTKERNA